MGFKQFILNTIGIKDKQTREALQNIVKQSKDIASELLSLKQEIESMKTYIPSIHTDELVIGNNRITKDYFDLGNEYGRIMNIQETQGVKSNTGDFNTINTTYLNATFAKLSSATSGSLKVKDLHENTDERGVEIYPEQVRQVYSILKPIYLSGGQHTRFIVDTAESSYFIHISPQKLTPYYGNILINGVPLCKVIKLNDGFSYFVLNQSFSNFTNIPYRGGSYYLAVNDNYQQVYQAPNLMYLPSLSVRLNPLDIVEFPRNIKDADINEFSTFHIDDVDLINTNKFVKNYDGYIIPNSSLIINIPQYYARLAVGETMKITLSWHINFGWRYIPIKFEVGDAYETTSILTFGSIVNELVLNAYDDVTYQTIHQYYALDPNNGLLRGWQRTSSPRFLHTGYFIGDGGGNVRTMRGVLNITDVVTISGVNYFKFESSFYSASKMWHWYHINAWGYFRAYNYLMIRPYSASTCIVDVYIKRIR